MDGKPKESIRCLCGRRWTGHIALDKHLGLRAYCMRCDIAIGCPPDLELFISLENGRAVIIDPAILHKMLEPYSERSSDLPKDSPINRDKARRYNSLGFSFGTDLTESEK